MGDMCSFNIVHGILCSDSLKTMVTLHAVFPNKHRGRKSVKSCGLNVPQRFNSLEYCPVCPLDDSYRRNLKIRQAHEDARQRAMLSPHNFALYK